MRLIAQKQGYIVLWRILVVISYDIYREGGLGSELVDTTWLSDTSGHNNTVKRDEYGNYEVLLDGNSKGSAVYNKVLSSILTTGIYFYDSNGGSKVIVDDFRIK